MTANDIANMVEKEPYHTNLNRVTIANFIRQQQAEIKDLKQQVAFLEDWRDTWSPTIKQLMNINVKVNDE